MGSEKACKLRKRTTHDKRHKWRQWKGSHHAKVWDQIIDRGKGCTHNKKPGTKLCQVMYNRMAAGRCAAGNLAHSTEGRCKNDGCTWTFGGLPSPSDSDSSSSSSSSESSEEEG